MIQLRLASYTASDISLWISFSAVLSNSQEGAVAVLLCCGHHHRLSLLPLTRAGPAHAVGRMEAVEVQGG
jgi:hypothetical protein